MALPPTCDSALPPWLPGFPSLAFPTTVSSLMSPWAVSLQSTADLSLGLLLALQLQASVSCVTARGIYGCSKDCLCDSCSVWTVTGQLLHSQPQMFLLCPKQLPWCVDQTHASVPHPPTKGRSSPVNFSFSPYFLLPTEFCVVLYILSDDRVLLPALSWCCGISTVSEGVFLMYLWREIYSMLTYSSSI